MGLAILGSLFLSAHPARTASVSNVDTDSTISDATGSASNGSIYDEEDVVEMIPDYFLTDDGTVIYSNR